MFHVWIVTATQGLQNIRGAIKPAVLPDARTAGPVITARA
jgi:hypothetical protein